MDAVEDPRWRVLAFEARQVVRAGAPYWWDNRPRRDGAVVVYQETIAGDCALCAAGRTWRAPPGTALLFAHGEDSDYGVPPDLAGPYLLRWATCTGAGLRAHWDWLRAHHGHAVPVAGLAAAAADRLFADLGAGRPADVHALVSGLAESLALARCARLSPVEAATEALLADPFRPIDMAQLARAHGCSREHLVRTFTTRTGTPPGRWLAARRAERALTLLAGTDLTVAAVAAQVGLGSAHVLARLLRRRTGRGPAGWRRG
jgi:AraC-like DNA-binding protein